MGKIFDMVFPMIANHRDNSNVRKKYTPQMIQAKK